LVKLNTDNRLESLSETKKPADLRGLLPHFSRKMQNNAMIAYSILLKSKK